MSQPELQVLLDYYGVATIEGVVRAQSVLIENLRAQLDGYTVKSTANRQPEG